ncbi:MlaA family lipoprotein [Frateuria aurantia]
MKPLIALRPSPVLIRSLLMACLIVLLAGCTIAKPRTDDPLEHFNRKMEKVNDMFDYALMRPAAIGYQKITTPMMRNGVNNLFDTVRQPVNIANQILQGKPLYAVENLGRMVINLLLGFGGLNDLASALHIPKHDTDFGVTLARWGVPEGDFLMAPFLGPTTMRDITRFGVDSYLFDPINYLQRNHGFKDGQYYIPTAMYMISVRQQYLSAEGFLRTAFDRYAFIRDAYRQQRLNMIYYGNPPAEAVEQLQGMNDKNFDPDQLLQQQQQWEQQHKGKNKPPQSIPAGAAPVSTH